NLAQLCRGHHTLKHHGGWNVSQTNGGVMHWESPAGRTYTDRPPSKARFMTPAPSTPKHLTHGDPPLGDRLLGDPPSEQPPSEQPPSERPLPEQLPPEHRPRISPPEPPPF